MHNLPGNAGVAGHSGSSPMWAMRSVFHAWPVQAQGRRAGVMVGCAAMICGRYMASGNGIAWRPVWCSSRATFRMIESPFAFPNSILICWGYY